MLCRVMAVMATVLMLAVGSVIAQDAAPEVAPAVPEAPAEVVATTPVEITSVDLSPTYPFQQADFEKQFAPELDAEKGAVEWKKDVALVDGSCNFIEALGQVDNVAVYAKAVLEADADCKVTLSLGSDDGITVIVGGKKAFAHDTYRGLGADQDKAEINLVKGKNEVLFRINQGGGGMGLYVKAAVVGTTKVMQVKEAAAPAAPAAVPDAPAAVPDAAPAEAK